MQMINKQSIRVRGLNALVDIVNEHRKDGWTVNESRTKLLRGNTWFLVLHRPADIVTETRSEQEILLDRVNALTKRKDLLELATELGVEIEDGESKMPKAIKSIVKKHIEQL